MPTLTRRQVVGVALIALCELCLVAALITLDAPVTVILFGVMTSLGIAFWREILCWLVIRAYWSQLPTTWNRS